MNISFFLFSAHNNITHIQFPENNRYLLYSFLQITNITSILFPANNKYYLYSLFPATNKHLLANETKVFKIEVLVTGLSFVFFKDSVGDSLPKASPDTKYNKIQVICYFKLLSCVF